MEATNRPVSVFSVSISVAGMTGGTVMGGTTMLEVWVEVLRDARHMLEGEHRSPEENAARPHCDVRITRTCEKCDGRGRVYARGHKIAGLPCPKCKGYGYSEVVYDGPVTRADLARAAGL